MDPQLKIKSILCEYAIRKDNKHVGSGCGGNIIYYSYVCDKFSIITNVVEDVDVLDGKLLWNPEFLNKSKKEIRERLDVLLSSKIEEENFQSIVSLDSDLNSDLTSKLIIPSIKDLNSKQLLTSEVELPDLSLLDFNNKFVLAMSIAASYAQETDNNSECKKYNTRLVFLLSQFDDGIALYAIRSQIGIDRLIQKKMDEDENLSPYLRKINSLFH